MVTITLESSSLDLLTPETTLARATNLNNAFQLLWRNASPIQKQKLNPVMDGYTSYYNKLRDNLITRLTEYGELEQWEMKYQQLRDQFEFEGSKITAPVVVPGTTPGRSVEVRAPESEKKAEDLTKALYIVGGIGAALFIFYLLSKK